MTIASSDRPRGSEDPSHEHVTETILEHDIEFGVVPVCFSQLYRSIDCLYIA